MTRALVVGALLGVGLSSLAALMTVYGCPLTDPIFERDTLHHF